MKTLIYSIAAVMALSASVASAAEVFVSTPVIGVSVGDRHHYRHHYRHPYDHEYRHHHSEGNWVPAHRGWRNHHRVWVEGYYR